MVKGTMLIQKSESIFLALLLVWVPLVYFARAADGFTLPKELAAILVIGFFAVRIAFDGQYLLREKLVQAVLLFTLWMMADSFCVGLLKMEALKGSVHLLIIAGAVVSVVFACGRGVSYPKLIQLALLTGFLMSVHGLIQSLGQDPVNWTTKFESRAFSTLGNPNYLGGYLAGLLPMAFIMILKSENRKSWLWFRAVALLMLAGLLVTRVRGAFLALGISSLFLMAAFMLPWGREIFRRNIRFVLAAYAILILGSGTYIARHGGLEAFSSHQISVQQRLETYKVTWEMIQDHPLFGIGLGQFGIEFPKYQAKPWIPAEYPQHSYLYSEHVHNEFLQFWVEGGLVGLLLFLSVLVVYGASILGILKNPTIPSDNKELLLGAVAGLIVLLVQSLSNFPLQIAPTAVLFGLYLAAPLALRTLPVFHSSKPISGFQGICLVVSLMVISLMGLRAIAASIAFRDTVGESGLGNGKAAVYYGSRLVSGSPLNPKAWNAEGKALEVGVQSEPAFAAYQKSIELNPDFVENLLPMADIKLKEGLPAETLVLCQRALSVAPNYAAPLWPMSIALFQLNRYDGAAVGFEKFSTYAPNDFQTYLDLGVCYMKLKRKDDAIRVWKKAYALNPMDPQVNQYLKSLGVNPNK